MAATLLLFSCAADAAPNDADRVLVIRNDDSAVSRAVAGDYARRRGVRHVLAVHCPDSARSPGLETIGHAAYLARIERPLRAYLKRHRHIDFIVLTKGVPIRVSGGGIPGGVDTFSLDSRLAALDYAERPEAIPVEIRDPDYDGLWGPGSGKVFHARAWANRFWNSGERFSHARFGGYLVTRLDGYTQADAIALTTRALQAEAMAHRTAPHRTAPIVLDAAPRLGMADKARQPYSILSDGTVRGRVARITSEAEHMGEFNADLALAADRLRGRGVPVLHDAGDSFVAAPEPLAGYASFGSNDPRYDAASYRAFTFVPGALAETAVSTSGRTFLPTTGGQSLIADLVAQGVTGAKGYVDEPLVQAVASPSILFDRYTRGWTLAESFYAASALVGWEDVIIGDPIARGWP